MPNRLQFEQSPYLLQHRENPVDWRPWGSEAFQTAREEDKPVFLSIGYSTCHWCHVMAHESFEDETVAEAINRDFIPIKVDREERPDVDAVYMAACVAMTGSGGWPLTVLLTPEQKLSRDWAAGAQAGEMLGAVLRACSQEPVVVLDTGGAVENAGADKTADRIQIANTLGALLKRLLDDGLESTVLIMGGDCLLGLMRQLDVTEIMPLCEVAPGVVLSQFTYGGRQWNLVSKSGGFGAKTLFYDLQNILERWKKELPAV